MAINKVIYGADTLVDLTEDTVTAEDVLNSKSFHTPDGVKRTGTASYPVTDVQVNGTSVMDGTVAKVEQPTAEVKTATDTFTTVNGGLLEECVIDLVSVQDLHGYSEPWVGGSRKNKLPPETYQRTTDAVGFGGNSETYYTLDAGTYTLSAYSTKAVGLFYRKQGSGTNTTIAVTGGDAGLRYGSFTLAEQTTLTFWAYISNGLSPSDISWFQLEVGSQPTPYEPYSNICPISGHTEVDLQRDGKNKANISSSTVGSNQKATVEYDNNIIRLTATGTYARCGWLIPVEVGKTYTFSCKGITSATGGTMVNYIYLGSADGAWSDSSPNYISRVQLTTTSRDVNITFTATTNVCFIGAYVTSTATSGVMTLTDVQLELSSTATSYEPYLGHLYQVQIGSTVYGGTVDLVSGVMNVDRASVDLGSLTYTYYGVSPRNDFFVVINDALTPIQNGDTNAISSCFERGAFATLTNGQFCISDSNLSQQQKLLLIRDTRYTDATSFKTAVTGQTLVYTLDTPQTIQLTPQQIEALVGQNNLSTPLDGQSIDSVKYREVFAFDDAEKVVSLRVPISMLGTDESGRSTASQSYASGDYFYKDGYMCKALTSISAGATLTLNTNYEYSTLDEILESKVDKSDIYANAGSHNSIYRGKYLGSSVTAEQWSAIQNGTFEDLFIGDYWTINSVNWRIAHFDYWLNTGDTNCTDHHVVIIPDTNLYTAKMNTNNDTTGGYYNSEMRGGANYLVSGSSNLYQASETIKSAFGSSHILTHREILTNVVSSDNASGWDWYDSSVDLMSEVMVYGTLVWSIGGKGYEVGNGKEQFALFRHDISKIANRTDWWLRAVSTSTRFTILAARGYVADANASYNFGIRPCFAIK